jgi:hypothetical protein
MNPSEGLGSIGVAAVALILVGIVTALAFGVTALIYIGLLLTFVAFVVMFLLCRDEGAAAP